MKLIIDNVELLKAVKDYLNNKVLTEEHEVLSLVNGEDPGTFIVDIIPKNVPTKLTD